MSGYQRPRYATGRGTLNLPRVTRSRDAEQINSAFASLEMADQQNLKLGQDAQVASLLLTDTNGVTWRVTITTAGLLQASQVPPR